MVRTELAGNQNHAPCEHSQSHYWCGKNPTVSMRGVALGEISLVSRLFESLDEAVGKSAATPIL